LLVIFTESDRKNQGAGCFKCFLPQASITPHSKPEKAKPSQKLKGIKMKMNRRNPRKAGIYLAKLKGAKDVVAVVVSFWRCGDKFPPLIPFAICASFAAY